MYMTAFGSLLTAVAAGQGAPYKTVLTHDFTLDEKVGPRLSRVFLECVPFAVCT